LYSYSRNRFVFVTALESPIHVSNKVEVLFYSSYIEFKLESNYASVEFGKFQKTVLLVGQNEVPTAALGSSC